MISLLLQQPVQINLTENAAAAELPGSSGTFGGFISGLLTAVMAIAALMLLLYLIWGAMDWITAAGDNSKIQKARDKITQGIIGMIVLSSTVAVFMMIQEFLGIQVLRFDPSLATQSTTTRVQNVETRFIPNFNTGAGPETQSTTRSQ